MAHYSPHAQKRSVSNFIARLCTAHLIMLEIHLDLLEVRIVESVFVVKVQVLLASIVAE